MNILITGGAGFIGSNLARAIQESDADADVLIVDDMRSGDFANLASEGAAGWSYRGQLITAPLAELDLHALAETFEPDIIFHEASITDTTVADQGEMIADNVEPFAGLLDLVVDMQIKLVWASSAATYGTRANGAAEARRPFRLEDAGRPANVYGFSKWLMENLHRRTLAEHPHLQIVGLRYFNVFGPGESHKQHMASMVYQLAQQMLAGQPPRIFRDGEQARDQVYVRDVVNCTLAAAHDDAQSGIYNLGTGHATSFNQIVAALNEALGTDLAPDYIDNPYPFYQDYTCADMTATEKGLRWKPEYPAHDAIMEYAQLLKQQYDEQR
ncbi:MAG: ADP-glyceromanno-heptose 6-epimerase [Phycisphaeraceae bacterium]